MKKPFLFLSLLVGIGGLMLHPHAVLASCPWYDPLCVIVTNTPTPTPSPTPIIFQHIPKFEINPGVFVTVTGTPTLTPSPSPTGTPEDTKTPSPTSTLTPTEKVNESVTETPAVMPKEELQEVSTPSVENMEQNKALFFGMSLREVLFGIIAFVVIIIVAGISNWTHIKSWIHKKTL